MERERILREAEEKEHELLLEIEKQEKEEAEEARLKAEQARKEQEAEEARKTAALAEKRKQDAARVKLLEDRRKKEKAARLTETTAEASGSQQAGSYGDAGKNRAAKDACWRCRGRGQPCVNG